MPLISDKLRALRHLYGYSQEYVSLKLGQSQPSYSKFENGKVLPKIDTLERMSQLYDLPLADIIAKTSTELVAQVVANPDFIKLAGGEEGETTAE